MKKIQNNRLWKNRETNTYLAILGNIGMVMLLFSVCRIFFYLFNLDIFPDVTFPRFMRMMLGGLRFDFSALMMINTVYILFVFLTVQFKYNDIAQKIFKYFFVITNSIGLMLNCIDMGYFQYTMRRTNSSFFSEFKGEGSLLSLILDMLADFWYIALIWIFMVFLLSIFYLKMKPIKKIAGYKVYIKYYLKTILALILTVGIWVIGVRGDFREHSRPITLSNAGDYVNKALEVNIVQNTPFCIFKTIGKKTPNRMSFFATEETLAATYNPEHKPVPNGEFIPKNVVIIIWESFSREFIGTLNKHLDKNYEGYTPFIDSLLQYSATFEYSYANGRKSIDALPSIVASIPFVNDPYVLSPFSSNATEGIGTLLKRKGYHTSFFHGAHRGSMGFWAFMNLNGFDHSYTGEEYTAVNPSDKGGWGVWDEEFLQFMAGELNAFPEPFCSVVFTLTSHHPYVLPEKYDGVFKEGEHPLHRCIGYTDYALRRFFEAASKQPWFENTLFVITADHANNLAFPQNRNSVGQMTVPVIFFDAGKNLAGTVYPHVAQQTDIMPTVLNYLHYDEPFLAFGQDAFDTTKKHIAINSISNVYQVFYQQYVLQCDDELEIKGLYDLNKDPFMRKRLEKEYPEVTLELLTYLKGFLQQYNNRMLDNRLTITQKSLQ